MDQALIPHDPFISPLTRQDLLDSCLHDFQAAPHDDDGWADLCDALDGWDVAHETRHLARAVALVDQQLALHPRCADAVRQAPHRWLARAAAGLPHPALRLVRTLRLDQASWTPAQQRQLLAHPDLCRVRHLQLDGAPKQVVVALTRAPMLPELRTLCLWDGGLTSRDLAPLMTYGALPHLQTLSLWGNPVGEDVVGLLAASGTLRTLCHLDLGHTQLGNPGVHHLLATPLPCLGALSLGQNPALTDAAADALLQALPVDLCQMYLVDLEGCDISAGRLNRMARMLLPRF